jgi:hypothetical protein
VVVVREIRRRLGEKVLDGSLQVIDRKTNTLRMISSAHSGGRSRANTYKFEASFKPKQHVIAKFELIGNQVLVDQFDTADPAGAAINKFILDGRKIDPPLTVATTKNLAKATLYRFD